MISIAYAAGEVGAAAPTAADAFWTNMGLIGVMFVLFYLLLIRPQQRRLKEQRSMLDTLQKGDTVVTGGGLVGSVSKIISDTEVEIDLGNTKVTALRYTIQTRMDNTAAATTTTTKKTTAAKTKAEVKKTKPKTKKTSNQNKKTTSKTAKKTTAKKKAA